MSTFFADYPVASGGGGGVTSLNGLTGALTLVGANGITITPAGSNITITGSGGTVNTIGPIDSEASPSADGATITGNSLIMQSASATVPGLVNTLAQTLSGTKTFTSPVLHPDGTVTNPAVAFANEPSTGIYRDGTGSWNVTVLGVDAFSVLAVGSNYNFGFGQTASSSPGNFLNATGTIAGQGIFAYANYSPATNSQTVLYVGNGPGGANPITVENSSYSTAGYLAGGGALFASPNLSQLNIGSESSTGYIGFNVGGRTLATERMRLTSTALTINSGTDLVLSGSSSGAFTLNAAATTSSYAVTFPASQSAGALTNNGSGVLTWSASQLARQINNISTATGAGSAGNTDYVYFVSGTTTLTLPTAVGNTNLYTVKNVGANTVTIATTSAQTIDGSASATLPVSNTSLDLVSNGTNWNIV